MLQSVIDQREPQNKGYLLRFSLILILTVLANPLISVYQAHYLLCMVISEKFLMTVAAAPEISGVHPEIFSLPLLEGWGLDASVV